jgi:hypothetical protein
MQDIMGGNRRLLALGVLACGIAAAQPARASFVVNVTESGGPTIPIVDNGPLDTDTVTPGVINVNTGALNSLLVNYSFTTLGISSNRPTGTPLSDTPAFLTQTGSVGRLPTAGSSSLTITAYDTSFLFPASNPKQMTTAASDTFLFTSAGSSRTFQSSFDPTNSDPPGAGVSSPLLAFVPPVGTGPFGTSNPGVTTALGTQPTPFGISNTTVITLAPGSPGVNPSDQFTGSTTVTAVPEPASALLLLAGAGGLAIRRRRRR